MLNAVCRQGSVDDVEAVFALNKALFAEAWSKASLLQVMQSGFDLHICEVQGKLVAYVLSQDILDETHIMQVAVSTEFQRQGIARRLSLQLLADKAAQSVILLEVRISNFAAQALYESLNFEKIAVRKGYYVPLQAGEAREDAMVMRLDMSRL